MQNEKNAFTCNLLKSLVSKQKNRFTMDGFDLDLTCTLLLIRHHWIGDRHGISCHRLWSNLSELYGRCATFLQSKAQGPLQNHQFMLRKEVWSLVFRRKRIRISVWRSPSTRIRVDLRSLQWNSQIHWGRQAERCCHPLQSRQRPHRGHDMLLLTLFWNVCYQLWSHALLWYDENQK